MTSRDFVYWLQGYFEILGEDKPLTVEQVRIIRNHLALVFKHEIDPSIDGGDKEKAEELQAVHDGRPPKPVKIPAAPEDIIYRC